MRWTTPLLPAAVAAIVTIASPALAAPSHFTAKGEAVSYTKGKATRVPNTLFYQQGRIRLEMASPVSADGATAFSVVIAQEGGKSITLLNPQQKQAMKLDAASLESFTENPSIQKISSFKLSEFGRTFRASAKRVGTETVAGHAATVYEQKGKDGHFKLSLSDQHDIPLRFTYMEAGKPAFTYAVTQLQLRSNLPAASFLVPKGYEVTDLAEMLKGMEGLEQGGHH